MASHLWIWVSSSGILATAYVVGLVLYRLFFHPLAKYPGPVVAKITNVYQLYHAYKGDRHLDFWRLHMRYGPIVRIGPNALSFDTNSSLKTIYGFSANVRKADFYDAFVHPTPNTHNTRDKVDHARKRRVLSHAFSPKALKAMERYILENERIFTRQVGAGATNERKGWSTPKNMADWCGWLTMDILGDLSFGKAFHMLESEENRYAIDLVSSAAQRHLICGTMPIIDRLGVDKWLFPGIAARRVKYVQYSRAQLTERTALGEKGDRADFFWYLLKATDPETGKGFSTPELWSESNLLIIAGSDTTSTAMAATLFYLTRHPATLRRAADEVRAKFSSLDDIIQSPALNELTYLRACIDEAQRLSPSVGGMLPREVLSGGITIDGEAIPAGVVVGTPHYAIHHNATYYPDPFAYVPERWLAGEMNPRTGKTTTQEDVETASSAFCQFSIGPRGCIGKELAYVELRTTLARLLYAYDCRRAEGVADPGEGREGAEMGREKVGEYQLVDTFTSVKNGPMVEFRKREGVEVA